MTAGSRRLTAMSKTIGLAMATTWKRPLGLLVLVALLVWLTGCASPAATDPRMISKRKAERPTAYAALPPEHQSLIDQGQIRIGMSEDAVYLAWGQPSATSASESPAGLATVWHYSGTTSDNYLYWRYREVVRPDGTAYLDRFMDRDINVRSYIAAELVFQNGTLQSWKTLPKPSGNTYFGNPGPVWY